MDEKTREIINMLHEPLDEKDKTKVTVSRRYANIDGEEHWQDEEEDVFSQQSYARRLHKVFGYGWNSKEDEVDLWGMPYCRCTVEAQLPNGDVVKRSGLMSDFHSFRGACEMFGIGGTDGAVLHVARRLNVMFGFDWGTSIRVLDEGFVCQITLKRPGNLSVEREAVGKTEEQAFVNAFSMFGIDPT